MIYSTFDAILLIIYALFIRLPIEVGKLFIGWVIRLFKKES